MTIQFALMFFGAVAVVVGLALAFFNFKRVSKNIGTLDFGSLREFGILHFVFMVMAALGSLSFSCGFIVFIVKLATKQ